MGILNPTPASRLVDPQGRPYFLWDIDMTLDRFEELLRSGDESQKTYLIAKLMRQAKPDDVFTFVSIDEIRRRWEKIHPTLGRSREFWTWLLDMWKDERAA